MVPALCSRMMVTAAARKRSRATTRNGCTLAHERSFSGVRATLPPFRVLAPPHDPRDRGGACRSLKLGRERGDLAGDLSGVSSGEQEAVGLRAGLDPDQRAGFQPRSGPVRGRGIGDGIGLARGRPATVELRIDPPLRDDATTPGFDDVGGHRRPGEHPRPFASLPDDADAVIAEGDDVDGHGLVVHRAEEEQVHETEGLRGGVGRLGDGLVASQTGSAGSWAGSGRAGPDVGGSGRAGPDRAGPGAGLGRRRPDVGGPRAGLGGPGAGVGGPAVVSGKRGPSPASIPA